MYTGAAPSAANVSGVTNFWAEGQGRADGNARVLPLAHEIERAVCGDGPAHSEMEAGPADAAKGEMGVHYWLRPCWCTPPPAAPVPVEVSGVR